MELLILLCSHLALTNEIIIKLKEESNFNKESVNVFLVDTLSETHPFEILKLEFVGASDWRRA